MPLLGTQEVGDPERILDPFWPQFKIQSSVRSLIAFIFKHQLPQVVFLMSSTIVFPYTEMCAKALLTGS